MKNSIQAIYFLNKLLVSFLLLTLPLTQVSAEEAITATIEKPTLTIKKYFDCPCPQLMAHRGASGAYPDSTLLAFEKALEMGSDILELDVHLSKDGKIIVSHDDSLLRTTGFDWKIDEKSFKEIETLDAGFTFQNSEGEFPYRDKGLKIITLGQLVKAFPTARFNIEIKSNSKKLAHKLRKYIRKKKLGERVVVASKYSLALKAYRGTGEQASMTSANLNDIVWAYIDWVFNRDLSDAPYEILQLPYAYVNQSLVDYFHKNNKQVHVWTVNDTEDIRSMLMLGVDGVMTDYPERAYPIYVDLGLR